MSYSQPQQQRTYKPNRAALWLNTRKNSPNQPDYKGNLEVTYALLQELAAAFSAGQYEQDSGGQPCIKLDLALYAQDGTPSASGGARPIMSGRLSTLAETRQGAAMRQQAAQQRSAVQAAPAPMAPQFAPAPAPVQQQWAQPQQPAPALDPTPQYQPQPAPAAAPPAYQQQPPAPAPMAPPAPVQPLPGAIHGQPPAGPAPTLPQGF